MQPFELVISIMIADLATMPMSEVGIPILYGVVPILGLFVMHTIISVLSIKSKSIRELISGRPSMLIKDGKIDERVLVEEKITFNELKEKLRVKGIYDTKNIRYAILETSGQISVIKNIENEFEEELEIIASPKQEVKIKIIKEIAIVFILIISIISINVATEKISKNTIFEIGGIVEEIEIDMNNNENAIPKIVLLKNEWDKKEYILSFLIEHNNLEEISNNIVLLKKELENGNHDEAITKILEIKFLLDSINQKNKFKLNNIF